MRARPIRLWLMLAAALVSAPARAAEPGPSDEALLPARLTGRAVLPAATFVPAPADAPSALKVSGARATPSGKEGDAVGSHLVSNRLSARSGGGPIALPFAGQPVQGISGLVPDGAGAFLGLSDNGFGGKANSADAMLMVHRLRIDPTAGTVRRVQTIFLNDKNHILTFPIVTEGTAARYLSGADLDPESLQKVGDSLWIGEEFGPFLVEVDLSGTVKAVFTAELAGKAVRGPDHPAPSAEPAFLAGRSKGFEGLARTPDGKTHLALLEGPLTDPATGTVARVDGRKALRILEFGLQRRALTGRSWTFALAGEDHAIGDFIMLDATRGLIIERDNGQGSAACRTAHGPCFKMPARYKRVVLIELSGQGTGERVRRLGAIDLLAITDPHAIAGQDGVSRDGAGQNGADERFAMPFVTIESLAVTGPGCILVGNDNDLPFSAGRAPQVADDSEFVELEVPALTGTLEKMPSSDPPPD